MYLTFFNNYKHQALTLLKGLTTKIVLALGI